MPRKPRLPKNVYTRGGTLWGRVQIGGREYRRSLRTDDPAKAARVLKAWRDSLQEAAEGSSAASETFRAAAVRWGREVLPEAVKPSVARRYLVSIGQLDKTFATYRIDQITSRAISDYISSRAGQVTNATIRRDLTALSRLLSACVAWGWADTNPARAYDRSIIRERKRVFQPPTAEELETLLSYAPRGMAQILRLLDQTGMRLNEAVTLERRHVDHAARTITLLNTKSSRPRTIAWSTPGGDATAALAAAIPHLRSPYLFRTRDDGAYVQMSTNFLDVMGRAIYAEAAAGRTLRRFRIHDLRHGFAVRWLRAGGGIYDLSSHLGHTSVKTTEVYLRYLTTEEQRVAKAAGTKTGTAAQTGTEQPPGRRLARD